MKLIEKIKKQNKKHNSNRFEKPSQFILYTMEVIFNHQIAHHRDIIGTIGKARRKWKHLYPWVPGEQRRLYGHMDRVYKEVQEKHNKEVFMSYAQERRLTKRIVKEERPINEDRDDYGKYPCLKPIFEKYNCLPMFYCNQDCGEPDFCQQQKNEAIK